MFNEEKSGDDKGDKRVVENIRDRVLTSLRWTVALRFSAQMFSWVVTLIVIRYLSPDDYGLKAMAGLIFAFLMMLSSAGIGSSIIQAKDLSGKQIRQVFGILILINVVLFTAQANAAYIFADYYNDPRVVDIIQVLALGFLLIPFSTISSALLSRALEFKYQSIVGLVSVTTGGVVTLVMALLGYGVWSLVIGELTAMAIRTVGLMLIQPWLCFPSFSFSGVGKLANFGGLVMLTTIVWFFYSRADIFIAGRMLGAELVGIYAVALQISALPMDKIMPLLHQVAFPAYSRLKGDGADVGWYFLKSVRLVSLILFPMFAGMAVISELFVLLVFGEKWSDVVVPLTLLCLVFPLRAIASLFAPVVNALGQPNIPLGNSVFALTLMVPGIFIGVTWGVVGLSIAWLVVFPIVFWVSSLRSLRVVDIPVMNFIREMRVAFLASSFMALLLVFLKWLLLQYGDFNWVSLILLIVSGMTIYVATVWVVDKSTLTEIMALVRKRSKH